MRFLMLDTTEYLAPKRTFLLCSDRRREGVDQLDEIGYATRGHRHSAGRMSSRAVEWNQRPSCNNRDASAYPRLVASQKNGLLLSLAEAAGFDVFLTMDRGLQYQQNLVGRVIAILIIRARSNRLEDLCRIWTPVGRS